MSKCHSCGTPILVEPEQQIVYDESGFPIGAVASPMVHCAVSQSVTCPSCKGDFHFEPDFLMVRDHRYLSSCPLCGAVLAVKFNGIVNEGGGA